MSQTFVFWGFGGGRVAGGEKTKVGELVKLEEELLAAGVIRRRVVYSRRVVHGADCRRDLVQIKD